MRSGSGAHVRDKAQAKAIAISESYKKGGNMPKSFEMCVKAGGRVRTKQLGNGKYMRICFHKGKSYAGHVEMMKENKYAGALKGK